MIATIVGAACPLLTLAALIGLPIAARLRRRPAPRLTRTHRAVLTAIASTDRPTDLAIHEATGYGPDRIYRALHMLQQAGWIRVRTDAPTAAAEDAWSIYYHLTDRGLRGAGLHTKDSTA